MPQQQKLLLLKADSSGKTPQNHEIPQRSPCVFIVLKADCTAAHKQAPHNEMCL